MQFGKIILLSIVAAVGYGILHDQVTARICIEYFTVFHPPVFRTQSPTLLGLGWGIIATWWMGAILGLLLAVAARAGDRPKISARTLIRPILQLLSIMAASAVVSGSIGYILASRGMIAAPPMVSEILAPASHSAFMADWWAHNASYMSAAIGGLILCILVFQRRAKLIETQQ